MSKIQQNMKVILTFFVSFFFAYGVIKVITSQMSIKQREVDKTEANIIQEEIKERFNLFLDISLVVGQISAEYLRDNFNNRSSEYGRLVQKVFHERDYILGLTQINSQGLIVQSYPINKNLGAVGKITQNIDELLKSHSRNEPYWFSPPFKLYQGELGFVFYFPIVTNKKLEGWIAPVISSQQFFEHFKSLDYFSDYELIIKDKATNGAYFSTALLPPKSSFNQTESMIRGRSVVMQSWRKTHKQFIDLPLHWYFFISLVFGIFATIGIKLQLQKKRAYAQLDNISKLLRLTAKEALSKLIDIHSEYLSLGSTGYLRTSVVEKDVESITNLIEQIDLLQTMAEADEVEEENFKLLPMIQELIEDLGEIINKKDLKIDIDTESMKEVDISANKWLVRNTVLKNTLAHCVLFSVPSKSIKIFYSFAAKFQGLTFQLEEVLDAEKFEAFKLERRLLVAKNAVGIMNGDMVISQSQNGGMLLKILFKNS